MVDPLSHNHNIFIPFKISVKAITLYTIIDKLNRPNRCYVLTFGRKLYFIIRFMKSQPTLKTLSHKSARSLKLEWNTYDITTLQTVPKMCTFNGLLPAMLRYTILLIYLSRIELFLNHIINRVHG